MLFERGKRIEIILPNDARKCEIFAAEELAKYSFLLIGQSNMAGRGRLDEAMDVDKTHIKTLRNGRWVKMFRPL